MLRRDPPHRNSDERRPSIGQSSTSPLRGIAALANQSRYARRGVPVANTTIRVMLVDDHVILRDGLRALLHAVPDIQVVGEAASGREAIGVALRCAPDVVVMDLSMPDGDGSAATLELARLDPAPRVLILTMHTEQDRLVPLLKAGARGFLSKDCAETHFIDAIRVVASGEFYVRPTVARILAANAMPHAHGASADDARRRFETLSARERSVLQRVAEGYSGVEIARMLDITAKTVDTYKTRITQKLGFTHRTDYVRFALRLGLIGDAASQPNTDEEAHLRRQSGLELARIVGEN